MVFWQAFPSLPPRAPLAFLSHLKLPFPSLSNACHAGYNYILIKYEHVHKRHKDCDILNTLCFVKMG